MYVLLDMMTILPQESVFSVALLAINVHHLQLKTVRNVNQLFYYKIQPARRNVMQVIQTIKSKESVSNVKIVNHAKLITLHVLHVSQIYISIPTAAFPLVPLSIRLIIFQSQILASHAIHHVPAAPHQQILPA